MKSNSKQTLATPSLHLSFDVGHSSIGWAVVDTGGLVKINGCGTVIFRADDCLASARRQFRRQRRHIRSTRQRIARLKTLLKHLGVLSESELDAPGCAWPWLLAAQVLGKRTVLSWLDLWGVLRWYAHNRGYDGNRRWSVQEVESQEEDSEKVENARHLMDKHGVKTMAETFCRELQIDPTGSKKSSAKRFKGLNAAFLREIVEAEVRQIIRAHIGKLPKVDAALERALLGNSPDDADAWKAIECPDLKLPNRYAGGLLFGQLVPRFDNRIIARCPVTGEKVPSRSCIEFMRFRWAMILANVRVGTRNDRELRPLSATEIQTLNRVMFEQGAMTAGEFKEAVRSVAGSERDNLDTMLMHPDAQKALSVDGVQHLIRSKAFNALWSALPEQLQKRIRGKLRKGQTLTYGQIRMQMQAMRDVAALDGAIERLFDASETRRRKKESGKTVEEFLHTPVHVKPEQGRAPYSRLVLQKAYEEVLAGKDPRAEGGCLFVTEQRRQAEMERSIAEQTNNHLVRHRLLILERLLRDVVKEYAGGDKSLVAGITIEVNRDLREMSGKTAKEKAQDLGLRIADHHRVATKLEEAFKDQKINGRPVDITAGLIRKGRIAEDLDWTCPYTGQQYEPIDLLTRRVDKDHIVPRSDRASDSLSSLVITFSAVNKWKGRRTAWQFVEEEQGKPVPDMPHLSIVTLAQYKKMVESLDTRKGHDEDRGRKKHRQRMLLLRRYEEKEFTPRDLTQTSQLVRMGAQLLQKSFKDCPKPPPVVALPGSVTGIVRKSWGVLGCLGIACPRVLEPTGEVKTKTEIRDITHLHHALDACVLGLASHFIPNNGRVWEFIVKRRIEERDKRELAHLGIFDFGPDGQFVLRDLDPSLKDQISRSLAEKRVVQHVPASMNGLKVEQNTWRVLTVEDGKARLRQQVRQTNGFLESKDDEVSVSKLLGINPRGGKGKLQANKGALVIPDNFGIALDPEPTIIPHHKVWPRVQELKAKNGGKMPRILRNGQIIKIRQGRYQGLWRVFSVKASLTLDLGTPDKVALDSKGEGQKREVQIKTLLRDGLEIARHTLTGVPLCPITS